MYPWINLTLPLFIEMPEPLLSLASSQRVDMSLHRINQFLLFLLNAVYLAEKKEIPFL